MKVLTKQELREIIKNLTKSIEDLKENNKDLEEQLIEIIKLDKPHSRRNER